jgi:hypothetical protein
LACGIRCRGLSATTWHRGAIVAILRHRSNDSDTPVNAKVAMPKGRRNGLEQQGSESILLLLPIDDIVDFQRLFERREPLRARGSAPLSARIERQVLVPLRDSGPPVERQHG